MLPENLVEAIRHDADTVAAMTHPRGKKPGLIANCMRAVASGDDFNVGGVFRQRGLTTVVVSGLSTEQADNLRAALRSQKLSTVADITSQSIGVSVSLTITLKSQL
jgi:hypothetical protein